MIAEIQKFNDIDLESIMVKAMDNEEGLGWTLEYVVKVAQEYQRYLMLCKTYPNLAIVPSSDIDEFWHLHILDTQKYAEDCQSFFGYFLHHFPYFGMRGEVDKDNLQKAWQETLALYKQTFGKSADPIIWDKSQRCPNCGRRLDNDMQFAYRPRLKDIALTQKR